MTKENFRLIAHGGFSARFPENTLPSYQAAEQFNPFAIEMDVVRHPDDGRLICFHPQGPSSPSGTFSTENVRQQIENGAEFHYLDDILAHLSPDRKILLDFKQPDEDSFRSLLFDENIDLNRIIVGVRDLDAAKFILSLFPTMALLALFKDPDDFTEFSKIGGKYFRLWDKDVSQERVKLIQNSGLEVWVTPGEKGTETTKRTAGEVTESRLEELMNLVNGVLVNNIELARRVM